MTWGLLARADEGGLGSQTWEMGNHCHPSRVLVVDVRPGRGRFRPERYLGIAPEVRVEPNPPSNDAMRWLCMGVSSVYAAECYYNDRLPEIAAELGVRLVVHANPELWRESYRGRTTTVVTPTSWEAHRIPGSVVMPMPVDRARLPFQLRDQPARRFLFPVAEAFQDRHGWADLAKALRHVRHDITLVLAPSPRHHARGGRHLRVTIETVPPRDNYWEYPDADALILPRRYGGLSLPIQECASLGMPVITLDLPPYAEKLWTTCRVPVANHYDWPMKGGVFPVARCQPRYLAHVIDLLADDPHTMSAASQASDELAESLCWDRWAPEWKRLLG